MSTAKKLMHDNDGYFEGLKESTQAIVKDAILKAVENRQGPEGYKLDNECLESVECHSRDGFIAHNHNKGGLLYRNFTDLMAYWDGGYTPSHVGAASEIERQIDFALESIQNDLLEDNKAICLELNIEAKDCTYHVLSEFEAESELLTDNQRKCVQKMIQDIQEMESERLNGPDNSIMHEFRFMYHGVNDKGVHEASVSAALNTEGPYHRSGISWAPNVFCEGAKEVEIKWKNNAELKRKLDKALKQVSKAVF